MKRAPDAADVRAAVFVFASLVCGLAGAQTASDGAATAGPKAAALAGALSLEESIDLLGGTDFATRAIPRLGIPAFKMSDGPVGARTPVRLARPLQVTASD